MSDAEINIAIAEWCGWTDVRVRKNRRGGNSIRGRKDDYTFKQPRVIPDFCHDLNAIHEAEKKMDPIKATRYISEIWSAMCRTNAPEQLLGTIHATARQRSEALLRTLGMWKE